MQIVALGDSVTAGCNFSDVTAETCYVALVRRRLDAAHLPIDLVPSALEGIDTSYAVKRFSRLVTVFQPDLVTIMLGLNDARPPGNRPPATPEEYRQNLLGLVDRVLAIDARPLLISPNPRLSICKTPGGESRVDCDLMGPYADMVCEVADHYQVGWVDVHDRFMAAGNWPALVPDGTHPSPEGHLLIAAALAEVLLPLVSQVVTPVREPSPAAEAETARQREAAPSTVKHDLSRT